MHTVGEKENVQITQTFDFNHWYSYNVFIHVLLHVTFFRTPIRSITSIKGPKFVRMSTWLL